MSRKTEVFARWRVELGQLCVTLLADKEWCALTEVKRAIGIIDKAVRSTKEWQDALAASEGKV